MDFQKFSNKIKLFITGTSTDADKHFNCMKEIFSDIQTNNPDVYWKALEKGNNTSQKINKRGL